MKLKRVTEDYLKTIYILSLKGEVHATRLAEELGVSKPVSLKSLEKDGCITRDENRAISLTRSGKKIAKSVYERHCVLRKMLETLGVDKTTAASDACKMEHAVSPESFKALRKLTKYSDDKK
jgi:DtxR family Mn-dependent transcriptional regulator